VRLQEPAGFQSFLASAPEEINDCSAGKLIFLVPGALAMPYKNHFYHTAFSESRL
jgi:hypothetical protein